MKKVIDQQLMGCSNYLQGETFGCSTARQINRARFISLITAGEGGGDARVPGAAGDKQAAQRTGTVLFVILIKFLLSGGSLLVVQQLSVLGRLHVLEDRSS